MKPVRIKGWLHNGRKRDDIRNLNLKADDLGSGLRHHKLGDRDAAALRHIPVAAAIRRHMIAAVGFRSDGRTRNHTNHDRHEQCGGKKQDDAKTAHDLGFYRSRVAFTNSPWIPQSNPNHFKSRCFT
jgi:hypothetical protein